MKFKKFLITVALKSSGRKLYGADLLTNTVIKKSNNTNSRLTQWPDA